MYIGYTDRCAYGKNKKKKIWKRVAFFAVALLIGCATMRVIAWEGASGEQAAAIEGNSILKEGDTVSAGDADILFQETTGEAPGEAVKTASGEDKEDEVKLVVIDPGHGGEDIGCSSGNILEKDVNLQIALALRDKLEGMGYEAIMTREDDTYLPLEDRVAFVNGTGADILVSIHQNAFEDNGVTGIETWYCGAGVRVSGEQSSSVDAGIKTEIGTEIEIEIETDINADRDLYRSEELGADSKRLAQVIHKDLLIYTEANARGSRESEELKLIREAQMPSCLVETGFLSNKQECAKLIDEAYQERIVEGIASGIDLYFYPKTMYLTFDDGPTAENTNAVLDILQEKNIKATFFVVGENVKKNPEVAKRIVEEGHTIGIHCNRHDYNALYESVDSYLADFEEAYRIVYEVTGVEVKLFRFPGGSINAYNEDISEDIIKAMTEKGFIYFDWNASLEDASKHNEPETLLQNAEESTLGRRKIVMLAHDIVYNTTLCLDELIEQFPEYRMEPLTPEVEPIQF